jgi:hypothetical protein
MTNFHNPSRLKKLKKIKIIKKKRKKYVEKENLGNRGFIPSYIEKNKIKINCMPKQYFLSYIIPVLGDIRVKLKNVGHFVSFNQSLF